MISLRSKVTKKLLAYYFLNPIGRHYVNELARILDLDPKNLHRKLVELEKQGLLSSNYQGKERFFFLNKDYPLLKAYEEIFQQTGGLETALRQKLSDLSGLKEAYLFGSYAKGNMDQNSDIDLLAVGEHSVVKLNKLLQPIQKHSGRSINVLNLSNDEFSARKKKRDPLLTEIFKGKTIRLT